MGPLVGWSKKNYDKLAQATVAGHIIECGAQCTGGNFSHWYEVDDYSKIGYPIITINSEGDFTVSKESKSSGIVNKYTVLPL